MKERRKDLDCREFVKNTDDFHERRKFERFRIDGKIKYKIVKESK